MEGIMKKMKVVFGDSESDMNLLTASVKALESEVLKARFDFTVQFDDSTSKTTLWFWRRATGGWNAQ
jgi:hypothetical protein